MPRNLVGRLTSAPFATWLRPLVFVFAWLAVAPAEAQIQMTNCGGSGQRACCVVGDPGRALFGACQDGLTEVNTCTGDCACGDHGDILSNSHCVQAPACGGDGQRACCLSEKSFGACKDGVTEVNGCSGGEASCLCGGDANPLSIQSNSHCQQSSSCGGPGQRACCVGERSGEPCDSGTFQVEGCTGDCFCGGDANPFSIQSSGTCVPATPCGGRGQRACCASEKAGGGCDASLGLVELPGCSGDCSCKNGVSTGMCTDAHFGPISEPSTNRTTPPADAATTAADSCPLLGYADVHLHMFADQAHGGGVLAGKPYAPNPDAYGKSGINLALQQDFTSDAVLFDSKGNRVPAPTLCPGYVNDVDPQNGCRETFFHGDHDPFTGDPVGSDLGTKDGAKSNVGAPTFGGWPRWSSTTHEQTYYKWLERAWQGGMRLTTMLAVTNEALCRGSKHLDVDCQDSMKPIVDQLAEAKRFESFIDQQYGAVSEKKGWFRIVYTPAEARQVIAQGKLAVVLGIEVAELFNCKFSSKCTTTNGFIDHTQVNGTDQCDAALDLATNDQPPKNAGVAACTPDYIQSQVKKYYDLGVRHIFPVHNFDNAFGASATWQDGIEVGNRVVEGHWWDTENCWTEDPATTYGFELGFLTQTMIGLLKFDDVIGGWLPLRIPSFVHADCNRFGLFKLGEVLIQELMKYGMLIDVDHLSNKAFDDTLALAEAKNPKYPVVATHVLSFDLHDQTVRHERHRTRAQLERIKGVGGMVAAMLKDEVQDTGRSGERHTVDYAQAEVRDDCRYSSKTFAQAYAYAVDVMGAPVAMGSDFNGIAGHFGPRFGNEACGGDMEERKKQIQKGDRLQYPFTLDGFGSFGMQQTGDKTYDYNVDGMAHIGLLPDFVADLKTVGMSSSDLDMLFRSAEAYIRVWERARKSGMGEDPAPNPNACVSISAGHSPSTVYDNTVVDFTAQTTPAGLPVTWDFGDGTTATGPSASHQYGATGTYTVTARTADRIFGTPAETTMSLDVAAWPYPAQVFFDAPYETPEGSTVQVKFTFNAINHFLSATCGGGVTPQQLDVKPGNQATPATGSMLCTYPGGLPASVDIGITVEYPRAFHGQTIWEPFTHNRPIQIINLPPSIGTVGNANVTWPAAFEGLLQLHDVDNEPLTLNIQWGDGTQQTSSVAPGTRFITHAYAQNKVGQAYQVLVTLSDEALTATGSFSVAVSGPPPTLTLSGPDRSEVGRVESYTFAGFDPAGGNVSLTQAACGGAGEVVEVPATVQPNVAYLLKCRFFAASDSNVVSVTYRDDEGRKTVALKQVAVAADTTPPVVTVPPAIVREATSPAGAVVTFQASATDDVDPAPTLACDAASGTFPLGTTTVSCTAKDATGNKATASFTITVQDTTPPAISVAVTPDANAAGWHKDPVSVQWSVTDIVGVATTTGCGAVSFINDTQGTIVTCSAQDAAGNTFSKSVTVRLDRTPPTIVFAAASPSTNANGWNRTDVSVGYSFSDAGSGLLPLAATGGTLTFTSEGAGQTLTVTAADLAGNVAIAASPAISIDKTPPQIVGSRSPLANASGWNNSPVTVSFSCVDGLSGVQACSPPSTLRGEAANQSLVGTVSDKAGNTATVTVDGINIDLSPPVVTCSNSSPLLWPANRGLVDIQTSVSVDGGLSGDAGFKLVRVTSSEPDNGDIQGFVPGTPDTSGQLRAERSGSGPGRVYSLVYEGSDVAGNRSSCTTTVTVPHNH